MEPVSKESNHDNLDYSVPTDNTSPSHKYEARQVTRKNGSMNIPKKNRGMIEIMQINKDSTPNAMQDMSKVNTEKNVTNDKVAHVKKHRVDIAESKVSELILRQAKLLMWNTTS